MPSITDNGFVIHDYADHLAPSFIARVGLAAIFKEMRELHDGAEVLDALVLDEPPLGYSIVEASPTKFFVYAPESLGGPDATLASRAEAVRWCHRDAEAVRCDAR